jgi:catechol 2,3-dioxygenase-like lactoylglutathione lyase family enzyme
MGIDARLNVIGVVMADMAASLAFYRRLGLDIPTDADAAPPVEVSLPGGLQLAWDTEATIRSFAPDWTAPTGGRRTSLAFRLPDPAAVDAAYAELTAAGYRGGRSPWDAFWGQRRGDARSRRPQRRPVRSPPRRVVLTDVAAEGTNGLSKQLKCAAAGFRNSEQLLLVVCLGRHTC